MDKKKINFNKATVLILDNSPSITGAFKSITSVTKAMRDEFNFIFALQSAELARSFNKQNHYSIHIPFLEIQKKWKSLLYFPRLIINSFRILSIVKKQHVKIIHVNDLYNMCGVIIKIMRPSTKIIYHVRLLPTSYAKKLYFIWKWLIEKYADEIICVSQTVVSNFSYEKATVVFDSIQIPKPKKTKEIKSKNNKFNILYLANYIDGKGQKIALEAFFRAKPFIKNVQLVFYGGTLNNPKNQKYKDGLINYANDLDLSQSIIFNDFAKNPELKIENADLMLNFSKSESFSMTTLEALIYGTPIIVTNCGGPSEIVEHNISGMLVPVNDIAAMADAIVSLANDFDLRNSFILKGKERVLSKFDFNIQVELLRSIYLGLLNNSLQD